MATVCMCSPAGLSLPFLLQMANSSTALLDIVVCVTSFASSVLGQSFTQRQEWP